jgi:O-antigen ligase
MQMTSGLTLSLVLGRNLKRDKAVLLVIALVVMGAATLLTSSRGGLIGLISVMLLVAIFHAISATKSRPRKKAYARVPLIRVFAGVTAIVGTTIIVLGFVLFLGGEESLMRGIGMTLNDSDITTGRSHFWTVSLRMFLDNPLIGIGWDAFGVGFTRYDSRNGYFRVEQAHNEYLQFLAEGGIFGFLCLAGFIYLLFRNSLKTIAAASGLVRDASIGALAGCFGIIVHSFFDFPLRTPSNAFFFLILCAIAVFPIAISRKV